MQIGLNVAILICSIACIAKLNQLAEVVIAL